MGRSSTRAPSNCRASCNNKSSIKINVVDPDPASGAFLAPGSGIRYEHLGSYFREPLETIFWIKILKFFNADEDPDIFLILDQGSGMNIPDHISES
jgi:hypothetical protein